jgi:FKBP-type peptidyl-prolyl cis-trans isomerase
MKLLIVTASLALALLSGCGGSDESPTPSQPAPQQRAADKQANEQVAHGPAAREWIRFASAHPSRPGKWRNLEKAAGADSNRLILPAGPPPGGVVIRDLRKGKGSMLEPRDIFGADYTSFDYKSGRRAQNGLHKSSPIFVYGVGELIKAWEAGLRGMRSGGVRELIAPGAWAYGGNPIVYVIELGVVEKEG